MLAYTAVASLLGYPVARRIVPVALEGTPERMPRGALGVRRGTVRVKVLDPVDAGSYSYDTRDELIARVRGEIAAALAGRETSPGAMS